MTAERTPADVLVRGLLDAQEFGEHNARCLDTECPVAWELVPVAQRLLAALLAASESDRRLLAAALWAPPKRKRRPTYIDAEGNRRTDYSEVPR